MRLVHLHATVLALAFLAAPALSSSLAGQGIPETEVWLEAAEGGSAEATWEDLRTTGLTLVVEGASGEEQLFQEEGLILLVLRVDGGRPVGLWRSRRMTGVPGGKSAWGPDYVPEAEVGSQTFRIVPGNPRFPSTQMMDQTPEGLAGLQRGAEEAGGDPSSFVALFLLPMEPAVAERTQIRPLYALPG